MSEQAKYTVTAVDADGNPTIYHDNERGVGIPVAEGNVDYQGILVWLAAGNTPDPME